MAAATIVSVEEYLRCSYDPDLEYVDGQLVERNVGEWRHSLIQSWIVALLSPRASDRFLIFTEQRVQVSASPPRYRIPDVCVVPLPYRPEPVLTRPPHVVIEVASPDDKVADILEKVAEYLKIGVEHVWMPDPYRRQLHLADSAAFRPVPSLLAETALVGAVDFAALFAKLDDLEH